MNRGRGRVTGRDPSMDWVRVGPRVRVRVRVTVRVGVRVTVRVGVRVRVRVRVRAGVDHLTAEWTEQATGGST